MSVTARASYAALATRKKLQGGIGQTKVRRYWPGKAPEWSEKEYHDHVLTHNKVDVLDTPYDPRLHRLAKTRTENREQVRADHQRDRQEAEIVPIEEETRDDEEDNAIDETRRRIREKNLKRDQEEASLLPIEEEEEKEEEEEEETDSEEEEMCGITMIKPIFVQRVERDTITERERLEAEKEALEELAKRTLEMRKVETRRIVVEEVKKDEEIRKKLILEEASNGDVETDDELNEAEEYQVWKTREIARTKRERDASESMQEVDKLKNMTEHEKKDPKLLWKDKPKKKKKRKFMQRYYHKGAFFQETGSDGIFDRDFSAPTGEDKLDRTKLRKVMQVKRFGRSGRSKWTYLVKEDTTCDSKRTKGKDTTDWTDLWITNCFLREKYNKKMAAMDGPIAKPKGNKKMKDW